MIKPGTRLIYPSIYLTYDMASAGERYKKWSCFNALNLSCFRRNEELQGGCGGATLATKHHLAALNALLFERDPLRQRNLVDILASKTASSLIESI